MPDTVKQVLTLRVPNPEQSLKLDARLAAAHVPIDEETRARMWRTLVDVLRHGDDDQADAGSTGLLLGRIQSGKTTAMTGLAALAHDSGYRLVIAILGTTNLLLSQNTSRLLDGLGISDHRSGDYTWAHLDAAQLKQQLGRELSRGLDSGRTVFVTVLKNSRRLGGLAAQLQHLDLTGVRTLILDDEADQASLNTQVAVGTESPTYRALASLISELDRHLYVQVTATPFAPLLLQPTDFLSPSFVEILEPGANYTGAKEFFVDDEDTVVRLIGANESLNRPPASLPLGLRHALANFLIGSSILLEKDRTSAPVSMLVHPTHRVAIHERVAHLLEREVADFQETLRQAASSQDLPEIYQVQLADLVRHGIRPPADDALLKELRETVRLLRIWVVNSEAEQDAVRWSSSPAHILVGGNKLDRGFTVEGLTVTYLSRATTTQADTLAQRARAFGYRRDYLPYCRFFATATTIDGFKASVQTEEAMRTELTRWLERGLDLSDWSEHVGFLLGDGLTPTRSPVAPWLLRAPSKGWHILANPEVSIRAFEHNANLVAASGLLNADRRDYGRLSFRTIERVPIADVVDLIKRWEMPNRSGWSRADIRGFIARVASVQPDLEFGIVLMDGQDGTPRTRSWRAGFGFSNLMQGRDNGFTGGPDQYGGDRGLFGDRSGLQIHWVLGRDGAPGPLHTLALHIGEDVLAATEVTRQ